MNSSIAFTTAADFDSPGFNTSKNFCAIDLGTLLSIFTLGSGAGSNCPIQAAFPLALPLGGAISNSLIADIKIIAQVYRGRLRNQL